MIKDRIWTLVSRKLSGEATTTELSELADFMRNQANAELYLQVIDEYWKIPTEKDEEFLEATYHLHKNRLKQNGFDLEPGKEKEEAGSFYFDHEITPSRKNYLKKTGIAFSVVSMVALLFFVSFYSQKTKTSAAPDTLAQSEVSTRSGARTRMQLPDGSTVWLNGSSKLVYDNLRFGKKLREVTLTGEAYFDIVKNTEKPFIIHANQVNIKVTGTAFNVKAYPGDKNTETSLIRGSIEVTLSNRKEKIIMKPNDKLIVSNEAIPVKERNAINKKEVLILADSTFMMMGHLTLTNDENTVIETAWVENKLVFDKESFEEVAARMERWYGVTIQFQDNKLKSQLLTGSFEKETVGQALLALQISTPFFKYKINNQHITIFK